MQNVILDNTVREHFRLGRLSDCANGLNCTGAISSKPFSATTNEVERVERWTYV